MGAYARVYTATGGRKRPLPKPPFDAHCVATFFLAESDSVRETVEIYFSKLPGTGYQAGIANSRASVGTDA